MFGLLDSDIELITKAMKQNKEIKKATIFGSRALGNYKKGSDVDIAIFGNKVTSETVSNVNELLNEVYPLPYYFELLHFDKTTNENLKEHINNIGRVVYINHK